MDLNRLSSDGAIANFSKDGTTVGSIGTTSGTHLYAGSGDVGLLFQGTADAIEPWNPSTNGARDNAINLGLAANRFKDIYLSGTATIGTNGSEYANNYIRFKSGGAAFVDHLTVGQPINFRLSNASGLDTTAMTLTSAGNLYVGGTSVGASESFTAEAHGSLTVSRTSGSGRYMISFDNGNTNVGRITSSASATQYNTSSDYRLKENVVPMTGSIDRVKALKPSRFNFIVDADKTVDGFLAHEAQAVVPECVTGTKDAMMDEEYEVTAAIEEVRDEDDNITTEAVEAVMGTRSVPDMQGIDQSKLVPLLTATIQELIARIEALENGE
jgi:hypothetical protein